MKNFSSLLIILFIPCFLFGQTEKKDKHLKLTINSGISITNYFDKSFYEGPILAFDNPNYNRKHLKNKAAPFFDTNLTYAITKKQHIGLGFSIYSMAYLLELDFSNGGFIETGIVEKSIKHEFFSYYLIHLWQFNLHKKTTLHWNNSLGLDYQSFGNSLNKWNPFYRTGLLIEQKAFKKFIFTFQPFIQTSIKPYTNKRLPETYRLRPITLGGSIGLKLNLMEFY